MPVHVSGLAMTPVKGTRLRAVEAIEVDESGARDNRRFFLIDERGRMVNAKDIGRLQTIVSAYSERDQRLSLIFPDGRVLEDEVRLGDEIITSFFGRPRAARLVAGQWSEAITRHVGEPLRLVEAGRVGAVDRGRQGAVSIISTGSLGRLAERADVADVDVRRFRMLIEVEGVRPHEEDGWVGRKLKVGDVLVRPRGHVGRCVITNRDPDSGEVTLQTLKTLGTYRRDADTTETVAFGIYGEVVEPGTIRVGDAVSLDGH